jgi:hypothetical protein
MKLECLPVISSFKQISNVLGYLCDTKDILVDFRFFVCLFGSVFEST